MVSLQAVKSELFLPPTHLPLKKKPQTSEAAADAGEYVDQLLISPVALHCQLELAVTADESGVHEARYQPFSIPHSTPAMNEMYAGQKISEEERAKYRDDPIALGRELKKQAPYDPGLYSRRDPRKMTETVVVRDYACKFELDTATSYKVAEAVFQHWPQAYHRYLDDFMSQCFGAGMIQSVDEKITKLSSLLKSDLLSMTEWGAYAAVQGQVASGEVNTNPADMTMLWNKQLQTRLETVSQCSIDGAQGTSRLSARDVYDLRPCILSMVETLKWIRGKLNGYGTKEKWVLVVLYWIQEMGRNLTDDLMLLKPDGETDYDRVGLHVPFNLKMASPSQDTVDENRDPLLSTGVTEGLIEPAERVSKVMTEVKPVGRWQGYNSSLFVDLQDASQYAWGWGHCANVLMLREQGVQLAPFLEYDLKLDASKKLMKYVLKKNDKNVSFTHIIADKWGFSNRSPIEPAPAARKGTLRDSLESTLVPERNFAGAADDREYGMVMDRAHADNIQKYLNEKHATSLKTRESPTVNFNIATTGEAFSCHNIDSKLSCCETIVPSMKNGSFYFKPEEAVLEIDKKWLPWNFADADKSGTLTNEVLMKMHASGIPTLVGPTKYTPGVLSNGAPLLQKLAGYLMKMALDGGVVSTATTEAFLSFYSTYSGMLIGLKHFTGLSEIPLKQYMMRCLDVFSTDLIPVVHRPEKASRSIAYKSFYTLRNIMGAAKAEEAARLAFPNRSDRERAKLNLYAIPIPAVGTNPPEVRIDEGVHGVARANVNWDIMHKDGALVVPHDTIDRAYTGMSAFMRGTKENYVGALGYYEHVMCTEPAMRQLLFSDAFGWDNMNVGENAYLVLANANIHPTTAAHRAAVLMNPFFAIGVHNQQDNLAGAASYDRPVELSPHTMTNMTNAGPTAYGGPLTMLHHVLSQNVNAATNGDYEMQRAVASHYSTYTAGTTHHPAWFLGNHGLDTTNGMKVARLDDDPKMAAYRLLAVVRVYFGIFKNKPQTPDNPVPVIVETMLNDARSAHALIRKFVDALTDTSASDWPEVKVPHDDDASKLITRMTAKQLDALKKHQNSFQAARLMAFPNLMIVPPTSPYKIVMDRITYAFPGRNSVNLEQGIMDPGVFANALLMQMMSVALSSKKPSFGQVYVQSLSGVQAVFTSGEFDTQNRMLFLNLAGGQHAPLELLVQNVQQIFMENVRQNRVIPSNNINQGLIVPIMQNVKVPGAYIGGGPPGVLVNVPSMNLLSMVDDLANIVFGTLVNGPPPKSAGAKYVALAEIFANTLANPDGESLPSYIASGKLDQLMNVSARGHARHVVKPTVSKSAERVRLTLTPRLSAPDNCDLFSEPRKVPCSPDFEIDIATIPKLLDMTNPRTPLDFPDALPPDQCKLKILALRETLAHSLGAPLTMLLCEVSFLNCPKYDELRLLTGSELPFTDQDSSPVASGFTSTKLLLKDFCLETVTSADPLPPDSVTLEFDALGNGRWHHDGVAHSNPRLLVLDRILKQILKNYQVMMKQGITADKLELMREMKALHTASKSMEVVNGAYADTTPPELLLLSKGPCDDFYSLHSATKELAVSQHSALAKEMATGDERALLAYLQKEFDANKNAKIDTVITYITSSIGRAEPRLRGAAFTPAPAPDTAPRFRAAVMTTDENEYMSYYTRTLPNPNGQLDPSVAGAENPDTQQKRRAPYGEFAKQVVRLQGRDAFTVTAANRGLARDRVVDADYTNNGNSAPPGPPPVPPYGYQNVVETGVMQAYNPGGVGMPLNINAGDIFELIPVPPNRAVPNLQDNPAPAYTFNLAQDDVVHVLAMRELNRPTTVFVRGKEFYLLPTLWRAIQQAHNVAVGTPANTPINEALMGLSIANVHARTIDAHLENIVVERAAGIAAQDFDISSPCYPDSNFFHVLDIDDLPRAPCHQLMSERGSDMELNVHLLQNAVPELVSKVQSALGSCNCCVNSDVRRAQLFPMLDAAGLLWNARRYFNPADAHRPERASTELGSIDEMHYWCLVLIETLLCCRETTATKYPEAVFETAVKEDPGKYAGTSMIGSMCERSFSTLFPLLPKNSAIRDDMRRLRSLSVMWGELEGYRCRPGTARQPGAWMPLALLQTHRLLKEAGLFDEKYRVPRNPWCAHTGSRGLSGIFSQSYHSTYYTDSYKADHFEEWQKLALRYQRPRQSGRKCYYPFSQCLGTPVSADFIPHRVERPAKSCENRSHQLVYGRFGQTQPLRVGSLNWEDTGLLQDLFSFEYRAFAKLTPEQRKMNPTNHVMISNWMAYARNHAIMALSAVNQGDESASTAMLARNNFRFLVDTYESLALTRASESVPVLLGFAPSADVSRDRMVTMYAGALPCVSSMMARLSKADSRLIKNYQISYLNEATMMCRTLQRKQRQRALRDFNFAQAKLHRGLQYTRDQFDKDVLDVKDKYIDFLQQLVIGMLIETGADMRNMPLDMLEPRETSVSLNPMDPNLLPSEFVSPRTRHIVRRMDFNGHNLTPQQIAILSLIPPNDAILGTLRVQETVTVEDFTALKRMIEKETLKSNENYLQKYKQALVEGSFAESVLNQTGPDASDDGFIWQAYDSSNIKDPELASQSVARKVVTKNAAAPSAFSQAMDSRQQMSQNGPDSIMGMSAAEFANLVARVDQRVQRDVANTGDDPITALDKLRRSKHIPQHIVHLLNQQYGMNNAQRYDGQNMLL